MTTPDRPPHITDPGDVVVDWNTGDTQDVISLNHRDRPDDWPLMELSPLAAIKVGQWLIDIASDALAASYRVEPGSVTRAEDYYAEQAADARLEFVDDEPIGDVVDDTARKAYACLTGSRPKSRGTRR